MQEERSTLNDALQVAGVTTSDATFALIKTRRLLREAIDDADRPTALRLRSVAARADAAYGLINNVMTILLEAKGILEAKE